MINSARLPAARLPALDGFRALAIILVLIGHDAATVPALSQSYFVRVFLGASGHLGVDVFFVLSGFLITSLLLAEQKSTGQIDLRSFYLRRVRRIFPAYYFYLAAIGIIALTGVIQVPLVEWLSNLAYLTDYPIGHRVWWTGHAWSLAIEEQFYLIWPALLITLGLLKAARFAIIAVLLLPIVRLVTYFRFPQLRDSISTMFHTRVDVLMVGCLLAIIWSHSDKAREWALGRRGDSIAWLAGGIVLGGLALESRYGGAYKFVLGYSFTAISLVTLLNYILTRPRSPFAVFLSNRSMVWIGRISYSLYLWQQLFMTPLNHTVLGRFPFNIFATFALACVSYYFIERRFYRPHAVKLGHQTQDVVSGVILPTVRVRSQH